MANFRVGENKSGCKPKAWNKATTTSVVQAGDMMFASSGEAVEFASAGSNLVFIGVASENSPSGEAMVNIYEAKGSGLELELVMDLDTSTAVVQGANLAWSSSQTVTASDTDPLFRCSKSNSGSDANEVHVCMKASQLFQGDAS